MISQYFDAKLIETQELTKFYYNDHLDRLPKIGDIVYIDIGTEENYEIYKCFIKLFHNNLYYLEIIEKWINTIALEPRFTLSSE